MARHKPSADERRRGREGIARVREILASHPEKPNPFKHQHDKPWPCLVCGYDGTQLELAEPKDPAA